MLTDRMDVGGAETHIAELTMGLIRRGEDVELLSEGGGLADALEQQGVSVHRMPLCTHNPVRLLLLWQKLRRLIREKDYDVLHAHARIPALLLRGLGRCGAARVVTVLPWKELKRVTILKRPSPYLSYEYFLAALIATSFASAPLFWKMTFLAPDAVTSFFASTEVGSL